MRSKLCILWNNNKKKINNKKYSLFYGLVSQIYSLTHSDDSLCDMYSEAGSDSYPTMSSV